MSKITILYSFLILTLLATVGAPLGADISSVSPVAAQDTTDLPAVHLLGFLAYDNDLSPYINEVIERVRLGTLQSPDVHVTLLVDGDAEGDSEVVRVQAGTVTHTHEIPWLPGIYEVDTGDAGVLADFLSWATIWYPSPRKILAMLGHGAPSTPVNLNDGQMQPHASLPPLPRGMDFTPADLSSGTHMSTPELGAALWRATRDGQQPFDLIFFDQCFMGNLDVLYEVHLTADVFVASPNYAYTALAYDKYLPHMTISATNETIAEAIVTEYQNVLDEDNPNAMFWVRGQDVPAIAASLSHLGQVLLDATNITTTTISLVDAAAFRSRYMDTTVCEDDLELCLPDQLVDLSSFATALTEEFVPPAPLAAEVNMAAQELLTALDAIHSQSISGSPWMKPEVTWHFTGTTVSALVPMPHELVTSPSDIWMATLYQDEVPFTALWLSEGHTETITVTTALAYAREGFWDNFLRAWFEPTGMLIPTVDSSCQSTPPIDKLLPPLNLKAALDPSGVLLSWEASPSDSIIGYNVYRDDVDALLNPDPIPELAFIDSDVTPGRDYTYYLTAVGDDGTESEPSRSVLVTIPPDFMMLTATVISDTDVLLEWTAPLSMPVTTYTIYAHVGLTDTPTLIDRVPGSEQSYLHTPDVDPILYYVIAEDAEGHVVARSNEVIVTFGCGELLPPRNLHAHADPAAVWLAWEGSLCGDLIRYHLYRKVAGTADFERITEEPVPEWHYYDHDVVSGMTYTYYVTAIDLDGQESAPSEEVTVTVEGDQPPDVLQLMATVVSDTDVLLEWTAPLSMPVATYAIYAREGFTGTAALVERVPGSEQSYTHTPDVDPVFYYVVAEDAEGNPIARSYEVIVFLEGHGELVPPADLHAEAGLDAVLLHWLPSPTPDVAGYNVYRRIAGEEGFQQLNADPVFGPFYRDATVSAGETISYYVTAITFDGRESEPSNVATVIAGQLRLSIPEVRASAGITVPVPVRISNSDGLCIGAMEVGIHYDPAVAQAISVSRTALTYGYDFEWAERGAGELHISSVSDNCRELYGPGALFWVHFFVQPTATTGSPLAFVRGLTGTVIYDAEDLATPVPLVLEDGALLLSEGRGYTLGDLNGDGVINAADAALALQIAVGIVDPTPEQLSAGDVNGDGIVTAADAAMILFYAVHQRWPEADEGMAQDTRFEVSAGIVGGEPASIVDLPIRLNDGAGVAGTTMIVQHGASLDYLNAWLDPALSEVGYLLKSRVDSSGRVHISVAGDAALPAGEQEVVWIRFQVKGDAEPNETDVRITGGWFNDVAGRDLATSELNREIVTRHGKVLLGSHRVFLPVVQR